MSIHFRYRPPKRKTCEGAPCVISIAVVMCLVSGIALIVDGLLFARPGLRAVNYKETRCNVLRYEILEYRQCKCSGLNNDNSPYCKSSFPCLQIFVQYNIDGPYENSTIKSMIHRDEGMAVSGNSDCSTQVCKRHKKQNTMEIDNFLSEFGDTDVSYPCMYNPNNPSQVIIERNYSLLLIILSLAIPAATFIASFICVCIFCRIGRKQAKKDQPPPLSQNRSYMNFGYITENNQRVHHQRPSALPGNQRPASRESRQHRSTQRI